MDLYISDIDGTLIETSKYILMNYDNNNLINDPYKKLLCFKEYSDYIDFYTNYIYMNDDILQISPIIQYKFKQNPFSSYLVTSFPRYYLETSLKKFFNNNTSIFKYITKCNYLKNNYGQDVKLNMISNIIDDLENIKDNYINIFIFDDEFTKEYINKIEQKINKIKSSKNININFILIEYEYNKNLNIVVDKRIDYKIWFHDD